MARPVEILAGSVRSARCVRRSAGSAASAPCHPEELPHPGQSIAQAGGAGHRTAGAEFTTARLTEAEIPGTRTRARCRHGSRGCERTRATGRNQTVECRGRTACARRPRLTVRSRGLSMRVNWSPPDSAQGPGVFDRQNLYRHAKDPFDGHLSSHDPREHAGTVCADRGRFNHDVHFGVGIPNAYPVPIWRGQAQRCRPPGSGLPISRRSSCNNAFPGSGRPNGTGARRGAGDSV